MLTTEDHRRDRVGMTYVYPVISRRACGVSIGINLNVNNACNWACIYCQVDNLRRGSPLPVDLDRLRSELNYFLTDALEGDFMRDCVPAEARQLVDVAFSGNGEPTCAAEFAEAVHIAQDCLIKKSAQNQIRLRLITNGSQLQRKTVQSGVKAIGEAGGEVWFKIDRVGAEITRTINGVALDPNQVLTNVRRSIQLAPTWIQTCWFGLDGNSPSASEREAYCQLLSQLDRQFAGIHLYGLARPSLQARGNRLTRLPLADLEDFATEIQSKTGAQVIINP